MLSLNFSGGAAFLLMVREHTILHLSGLDPGEKMELEFCVLGPHISLTSSFFPPYLFQCLLLLWVSVILPQFYHFLAEGPWFSHP